MRVWSFSSCEYDEEERRLWVRGKPAKLGDRVLDVLEALLKAPDYQSTSVHLSRIWGPSGSIDSVKDAIRQLRRAIEQGGIPDEIIATVRGTGFQIAARVIERTFEPSELWRSLIKDAPAPGLPGWRLQLPLEPGTRARVWQIGNERNHQVRVVKYATDPARRAALRREDRSWEAFERGLTSQKCFVRIFSSHLTSRPCYLEMEYGGLTLLAWSDSQRTEGGLPRELCLQIMADLAYAVAAVHSLGIVHNDLKPANVLISPSLDQGGRWQVKITDFGVASVVKENRLAELQLDDSTLQPAAAGLGRPPYSAPMSTLSASSCSRSSAATTRKPPTPAGSGRSPTPFCSRTLKPPAMSTPRAVPKHRSWQNGCAPWTRGVKNSMRLRPFATAPHTINNS
jgi:serine/threonine protein kinase